MDEHLEILRRIAEAGLKQEEDSVTIVWRRGGWVKEFSKETSLRIDMWQHMLNEIEQTEICYQKRTVLIPGPNTMSRGKSLWKVYGASCF